MPSPFDEIHNYHERAVFEAVRACAARFPHLAHPDLLADITCVALNRIPPRYIRHAADFTFYQTDRERADNERVIAEAVAYAFEFVQARQAMRARA